MIPLARIRDLLCLTFAAFGLVPEDGVAQALEIHETIATRGAAEAPFGSVFDMLEVGGVILVSDDMRGVLEQWDPSSGRVSRVARTGQGPGEVISPTRLVRVPEGGFAVYDVGASSVFFFDRYLAPGPVVRVPGIVTNPKGLAIDSEQHIWISGGRLTDPRHLHRFDREGVRVSAFGEPSTYLESQMTLVQSAGGALAPHPGGGIVFSQGAPLRILHFPGAGFANARVLVEDRETLPEFREEELMQFHPDMPEGMKAYMWWHDRTSGVFVFPDGRILNVITRFHKGDSIWDLYSTRGERLARTVVDRAYYAHDLTSDGQVLVSYQDVTTHEHVAAIVNISLPVR